MKKICVTLAGVFLLTQTVSARNSKLGRAASIEQHFLLNQMTMERYFNSESLLQRQGEGGSREDIYTYATKSPFKAFILSFAVPGAGEFYTGSKIEAGAFLVIDAMLWTGYFVYHKKGSNKENEYKAFADQHYSWQTFMTWWNSLPDEDKDQYSHRLPWDNTCNCPIYNHEYYENIGKYDEFQVGWGGADGINHPPPPTWMPADRATYLDLRKKSNDYFSNATTAMMISIANHIVSAFDAAIRAKKFNKGVIQYSLKLEPKKIDGQVSPFLTLTAKF